MTTVALPPEKLPAAKRTRAWRRRPGPVELIAAAVVIVIVLAALWPGLFAGSPPNAASPANALAPPGSPGHLLGTDQLGRDTYSRLVYGARPSLTIGVGATVLALVAGALLGVVAATARGAVDHVIMRVTDVLLAFPGILLALLIVAALGPGTENATLAIAVSTIPGFVRLARAQALVIRGSDYVRAAIVLGRGRLAIHADHVLPNALPPLLVLALVNVGASIIAGSSLSFLGLGPRPPSPEWGAMLSDGRDYLGDAWALAVFPGLAVTLTVVAINVLGRALRRAYEGRRSGGRE